MEDIKIDFWGDGDIDLLFCFRKGAERRKKLKEVVIAVLRNVHPRKPTKDQLQKLSKIRRETFIPILKALIDSGIVMRTGCGVKGDPYCYFLAPHALDQTSI